SEVERARGTASGIFRGVPRLRFAALGITGTTESLRFFSVWFVELFQPHLRSQVLIFQRRTRNTPRDTSKRPSRATRRWFAKANGAQICSTISATPIFAPVILAAPF